MSRIGGPMLLRAFRITAIAVLFASACCNPCSGQTDTESAEYQIKAAFLYRFGNYIEWPAEAFARADSALVIGVLGADSLADELARIVGGRQVSGRPITVRKLRRGDTVAGLHVLFIGRSERAALADLLAAAKGRAVLTVTESDPASAPSSVINFVVIDDKVRFDITLEPADQGNLRISSRLLAVARKVIGRPS
jgi:hypothetical protein